MVASRRLLGALKVLSLTAGLISLSGCYFLPQNSYYEGPPQRPLALDQYYARDQFTGSFTHQVIKTTDEFTQHRYTIQSTHGPFTVDFYKQPRDTDSIVFVFPVLGGKKNIIEGHFAEYFAKHGIDAGIVQRNEEFKKPENFDRIEEVMRENVVRDRMAIDFFEHHLGKKQFGTFGISRGAINVAMTAGVDERLKYNVILMGGSDLVELFSQTDQRRVRKFVTTMMEKKKMTEPELYEYLRGKIKTDPKYLARFIDGRNSLLMLALFDSTVPIETGFALRHEMGDPETIVLLAGHYSSIAFTSIADHFLPTGEYTPFPIDYVETESLRFYRRSFGNGSTPLQVWAFDALRFPLDIIGQIAHYFIDDDVPHSQLASTPWDMPIMHASVTFDEPLCSIK